MTVIDTLTLALLAKHNPTVGIACSGMSYCAACMVERIDPDDEMLPWPSDTTPDNSAHKRCAACFRPLTPTLEYLP